MDGSWKIVMDGSSEEVTESYLQFIRKKEETKLQDKYKNYLLRKSYSLDAEITKLFFLDREGKNRKIFDIGEFLTIRFEINVKKDIKNLIFQIQFERSDGNIIWVDEMEADRINGKNLKGKAIFQMHIDKLLFGADLYEVQLLLYRYLDEIEISENENRIEELAILSSILKVENPVFSYENPAWHSEVQWNIS